MAAVLATLSVPVVALAQSDAVRAALDLCTQLPGDIGTARTALRAGGWEPADDTAAMVLFNGSVAFNFDAADLAYTFENAMFMAASILGNSSLGPDQIGMNAGDYRLAVLGLPEGTPYCLMTGPTALLGEFLGAGSYDDLTTQSTNVLRQGTGYYRETSLVTVGSFEMAELAALLAASGLPAESISQVQSMLAAVTLQIYSAELLP